jgi:hypothetical protein
MTHHNLEQEAEYRRELLAAFRLQCRQYLADRDTGGIITCVCGCGRIQSTGGRTEDLEFSHKKGTVKLFNISDAISRRWGFDEITKRGQIASIRSELEKCELRAYECHLEYDNRIMSIRDDGLPAHGTHSRYSYYKCRCLVCRKFRVDYKRGLRMRKRNSS